MDLGPKDIGRLYERRANMTVELAPRSDGSRYRRVTLVLDADSKFTLRSHEMGADDRAAWGLDDEEVTLCVPPDEVGRLALALAAEILKGGRDAVQRLERVCEDFDVPCRVARWT